MMYNNSEEIINQNIQIIEYAGENVPLFFAYILDTSTETYGLNNFRLKDVGIPLLNDNIKITPGTKEYSSPPNVVISEGGGVGARGEVVLENKKIKSINIINGGAGYTSAPSITLVGGVVEKEGTNTTIEVLFKKPDNFVEPPSILLENTYVWVHGKGAFVTQTGAWIFLKDLTNFFIRIDKIYTTTDDGSYILNKNTRINDPLNQIKYLRVGEGYILVVKPDQSLPLSLYDRSINLNNKSPEKIVFDLEKCFNINQQNDQFIDNNAKAIGLDRRIGICKPDHTAIVSVIINLTNLQKNKDYHIHLYSPNHDIVFINSDFYLNNNQLINHSVYAKIKFLNNTVNNIFTIYTNLNIGNNILDQDILSIYVDCPPPPPPTPTPRPIQPIVRIVE
jgi:hypothetical protein